MLPGGRKHSPPKVPAKDYPECKEGSYKEKNIDWHHVVMYECSLHQTQIDG
jgi:hypothetical protein